jgi:GDPmannose 4,6-dehydratase
MSVEHAVIESKPDYVFHFAAQSFVKLSFYQPKTTVDITPLGGLNLLEAIRIGNPGIRFYQASTSEMYP